LLALALPGKFTLSAPTGKCSITGEIKGSWIENGNGESDNVLSCKNVTVTGSPTCVVKSVGAEAGTITTKSLQGDLTWLKETGKASGNWLENGGNASWMEIEITGCALAQEANVFGIAIAEHLPVGVGATSGEMVFPNPPIATTWDNGTPRKETSPFFPHPDLWVAGVISTLSGKFTLSLNSKEWFGVSPDNAPRWSVSGAYLGAGVSKAFTAKSTAEIRLKFSGGTFAAPAGECSTSGEIEGSLVGSPGSEHKVVLTCKKVAVVGNPKCTVGTPGAEAGTSVSNSLKGKLVWLAGSGRAAAELLEPSLGTDLVTQIEFSGPECIWAPWKITLTGTLINEFLPVEKEATTAELKMPTTSILTYYGNEVVRSEHTVTGPKFGAFKSNLSGALALTLNSKEAVGVSLP
jgi:hypothetical protein